MTCSPQLLRALLDEAGLFHWDAADPKDGSIVAFAGQHPSRPSIFVHVRVDSDGNVITAMVTALLRVPQHQHLAALMQAILHEAYLTNLGQWEMDPRDGEVRVTVQLPVFDTVPTARQVQRVVGAVAQLADRAWPRLMAIVETGDDPVLLQGADDPVRQELRRLQARMQALLDGEARDPKEHN